MLTPEQATTSLVALLGSGGLASIMVAVLNFRTAAHQGRKPSDTPAIAVGAAVAAANPDREAQHHLGTLAYAMLRIAAVHELRAEHDMKEPPGFRDRLDDKVDRLMIEAIKAWIKAPS